MSGQVFKYNPLEMNIEDLENLFVGRDALLDEIVERIEAVAKVRSTNHFILIGSRGMGKTAMLRMIERGIEKRSISNLFTVQSSEEAPGIASLHQFFIYVLDLLVRKYDSDLKGEVEEIRMDFNDRQGKKALELLKGYLNKRGKKVLLLIDNIDFLLQEQLSGEQTLGKLRDILMNEEWITVVGTAHASFKEIEDYRATFFSLFDVKYLDYLKPAEITQLLENRAVLDSSNRALERIRAQNVNIKAITELTGGSPRLILILYELIVDASVHDVINMFNKMLDDHTELYRERLRELTGREKEIINAMMIMGGSSAPSEIAKYLGMRTNAVTALMSKMVKNRFLKLHEPEYPTLTGKCAPKIGKKRKKKGRTLSRYTTADGIFRIWYTMRYPHIYGMKNLYIVEFLSIWYRTGAEIESLFGKIPSSVRSLEKAIGCARSVPPDDTKKRFIDSIKELLVLGECEFALEVAITASRELGEEMAGILEPLRHACQYFISGDKRDLVGLSPEMAAAVRRVVEDVQDERKKEN